MQNANFPNSSTSPICLKMQAAKKQAFLTKNYLPADKFLPASDFYFLKTKSVSETFPITNNNYLFYTKLYAILLRDSIDIATFTNYPNFSKVPYC